jgi:predicted molibdopterin-dependent oxidoreductase YjgC
MEKSILGEAGYMSGLPKRALNGMIDVIKGIEPDMGYQMILKVSEAESAMRESRDAQDQNGLHWVQLISRYGKLRVRALVTDRVHGKELYMPMNSSVSPANLLTGSHTDKATHTPAYKEASVKMVVLDEVGESPLPRVNSRFHRPTPQKGVEVERKWKRIDYEMPNGFGQDCGCSRPEPVRIPRARRA